MGLSRPWPIGAALMPKHTRKVPGSLGGMFGASSPYGMLLSCSSQLKETTGGEFRVHRAFYKASIRYIDLL